MNQDGLPSWRRIVLWGGPHAGKSTLAAAACVTQFVEVDGGTWQALPGGTDPEPGIYAELGKLLQEDRLLPDPDLDGETRVRLNLRGTVPVPGPRRTWWQRRLRGPVPPVATRDLIARIELLDRPGDDYRHFVDVRPEDDQRLSALADADGLVYVFDPVAEIRRERSNRSYQTRFLRLLRRWAQEENMLRARNYLPHRIAVCVTKYDETEVYNQGCVGGFGTQGPDDTRTPRVSDVDAVDYLRWICRQHGADDVFAAIRNSFDPERVRYFVTSATGFYVRPGESFDANDHANVEADGKSIRGLVRPVNVLEPLIWLAMPYAETVER
ncbi:hypothetical protein F4553_006313 [Allocatelliglobosispora scoriae]|uniref:Uncharacterized protein n=1 Tax=Allocatelliglobosispora scoriae TaxID=643052 RepID=A0A841C0K4_9ACTN|nr:hypothetical protein [Allocatelliglobosispora scoriae]MBB5872879.1 hypothetical protein [Allocatelliglobosispora scoriae]